MKVNSILLSTACWLLFACNGLTSTLYVDVNSINPVSPYTGWSTASTDIQSAVDAAFDGDQILVTNGVYSTGGRVVYGSLTNRVVINKAVTVQSVNGPAVTVIKGNRSLTNNAVRCVYLTNNATLIGFALFNGATRSSGDSLKEQSGGGAWCESTNVIISNCVFSNNIANSAGGGIKQGKLNNCVLTKNAARNLGGGADSSVLSGCALSNNYTGIFSSYLPQNEITPLFVTDNSGAGAANSWLDNCLLSGNQAIVGAGGAAVYSQLVNCRLIGNLAYFGAGAHYSTLNNCLIVSNSCSISGGGTYSCILTNCLVSGNSAGSAGGGGYGSNFENCTVVKNSSPKGGGVASGTVHNAIVYFNYPENFDNTDISPMSYCCTMPTHTGIGNFTNNPAFVDVAAENFRLQTNSPCINAGSGSSSATDLDGRPRIVGGQIDVGAYEFQGAGIGEFIAWLQQYRLSADGSADYLNADGDGLNNWQEWIAGTIPTNAASVLLLAPPSNTLSGVTVTWQSVSNRTYYLQASTNLAAQFISIQSNLVGKADSTSYVDNTATNADSYFYRVGVQ